MYKKIILETNIHRVGFNSNNRIKGTRAYKYSHIIKKLIYKDFSPTTSTPLRSKTVFCYMTLQSVYCILEWGKWVSRTIQNFISIKRSG